MKKSVLALLFGVLPLFAQFSLENASGFASNQESHTSAALIAESDTFVPGETLRLGVVMTMDPHWHTYWLNPGDAGMPTQLDWSLPEGFDAGEIRWPVPSRYDVGGVISLGYEDRAVLVVPLQTPDSAEPGKDYTFRAEVEWLECKDVCLPGDASVEITLRAAERPGEVNPEMTRALEALPETFSGETSLRREGDGVVLTIKGVEEDPQAFYPLGEGEWQLNPMPEVRRSGDRVEARLTSLKQAVPDRLRGVLAFEEGRGVWVEAETGSADGDAAAGTVEESAGRGDAEDATRGTWYYLAVAFVAGVGMNLLPCIFPVLGLKISGFVEQAQGDRSTVKTHALVFAAGVLVSMWIVAGGVALLGGAWGAQFQDPNLVIGMLLVLTFFTMNLFGVFEMGLGLTTVGGDLTRKQGYGGSFFQGVLLTVIGTPCTGPILVLVIAWMLAQPLYIGFLAFTLMGVGLAAPYVLLAFSPALMDRLPPPGTWMVTFKKASAFGMVAFLWVLVFVLKELIPVDGTVRVLGALLLICFAAWVLGTWDTAARKGRTRWIAKCVAAAVWGLAAVTAYSYKVPAARLTPELESRIDRGAPIRWDDVEPELARELLEEGVPLHYRPWSPALVEELRAEGRAVFVDFTAEWCTICKVNKVRALHREEVMRAFQEKGVVTLRADWTGRDETIAAVLESYGRRGVPVYALHPEDGGDPRLLPEKLTPETIAEALDSL